MENVQEEFKRSVKLMKSFWEVQRGMIQFIHKTASDNGLSMPQYSILWTIAPEKEIIQKTLGEKTYMPKSTLSQAVDGLVQKGLLNRKQVEGNRREVLLVLSEEGEIFLQSLHHHKGGIHRVFQKAIEPLTDEQFEELLTSHELIAMNLAAQATEQGEDTK